MQQEVFSGRYRPVSTVNGLPAEAGSNGSGSLPCRDREGSHNCMKNGTLVCQVADKIKDTDFTLKQKRRCRANFLPPLVIVRLSGMQKNNGT
ncbi:MAG: hypothetical protein NT112_01745 [Methanoregula sp.]|nr:hypothetical protein [Methanoregula sp.]